MSKKYKVFDASYAPREEVDGVLSALRDAGFDVFEIGDSKIWGGGAVCVRKPEDQQAARRVVETFQAQWCAREDKDSIETRTNPYLAIATVVVLLFILFINVIILF